MKIKSFIISVIVVVILIIAGGSYIVYSLNYDEPDSSTELIAYTEKKVKNYLIDEKGYEKEEIESVISKKEPKSSDSTASGYSIKVTFSDEPGAYYFYQVKGDKVYQFGTSGGAKKHIESE